MKITMHVPFSRVDEATKLALRAMNIASYDEAYQFAVDLGGYQDYGGLCGDADHIGDFLGGAITGYICEKADMEELNGEMLEFAVDIENKEVR